MPLQSDLPPSLRELLSAGVLRPIGESEFVMDALRRRERTGWGWSAVTCSLRIEEAEDGTIDFDVVEETEDVGGDVLISSPDPDEVASWIRDQVREYNSE